MILPTLQINALFFHCLLKSKLGKNSPEALAYLKLKSTSFTVQEKYRFSYKSIFSGIKAVIALPSGKFQAPLPVNPAPSLIYDLQTESEKVRREFLKYYQVKQEQSYISNPQLSGFFSNSDKIFFLLLCSPLLLYLILAGILIRDKSGFSRILQNIVICRNLVYFCRQNSTKRIYQFSIYETHSAFLSFLLMREKIEVNQIASEVPLYKWNQIVLTNNLILCCEYQKAELESFRSTQQYDQIQFFGPETFYQVAHLYNLPQPKNFKIGFYSTGGWVRKKLGHI
jgi:hypothetical protein